MTSILIMSFGYSGLSSIVPTMAKPKGTHFIVTASRTDTGAPAYRRSDGGWSPSLEQAHAVAAEAERDAMLAAAAKEEALVTDPYAFSVRLEGETIIPLISREQIRATGPTVPYRRADSGAGSQASARTHTEEA